MPLNEASSNLFTFVERIEKEEGRLLDLVGSPDHHYTLFRNEDMSAWLIFTLVFIGLVVFDNAVLHRGGAAISFKRACVYTVFWISCAVAFCGYIAYSRGMNAAFQWGTGYVLEWMLSVDNLFVFHMIFKLYATPDYLKHKPLFWGIAGAIVFRMLFFVAAEALMHSVHFMHIIFGLFLVYTGIKTVYSDDEEDDPRKNSLVIFLSQRMNFVKGYDAGGAFFVKVGVDPRTGQPRLPAPSETISVDLSEEEKEKQNEKVFMYKPEQWYSSSRTYDPEVARSSNTPVTYVWHATMLFLVVVCLEVTDLLFAVDSVSAIVAQIPDLYLAYTACVFAMLGLRALFFVIDELIRLFSLLSYGVAAILVFIGAKLILKKWVHVPPGIVCGVLVGTLTTCMVASVIKDKYWPDKEDDDN